MRVLLLCTSQGRANDWAKSLGRELSLLDIPADVVAADSQSTPIGTAQYKLVCLFSSFRGVFRPQIPDEIEQLLRRCTRLQGKKGVSIVTAGWGAGKAQKILMGMLERQGMLVDDFAAVGSERDLKPLAQRIQRIVS